MPLPYEEGTWFAVPLRSSGYGLGVVARATKRGKVLLGYFFGPRRDVEPTLGAASSLRAADAVLVVRFGDLYLIDKSWPIIGCLPTWRREEWPMPSFVRRDELSGKAWRVEYADDNPNEVIAEEILATDSGGLGRDSLLGAGAVEIVLTNRLLC